MFNPKICHRAIRIFKNENFIYAIKTKKPQTNVTIALDKSLIDLYLRFGEYAFAEHKDKKYIVVARIGFKKQKNGYGTALIKELCNFGENLDMNIYKLNVPIRIAKPL